MKTRFLILVFQLLISLLPFSHAFTQQTIWEIGKKDDSSAEFNNYSVINQSIVESPNIVTTNVPKGLKKDINPFLEIKYQLSSIPVHGVTFSFKLLDANKIGPEMAVFSNGPLAGLIQLWGIGEINFNIKWKKTYKLYIPKELLVVGANVLRLEASMPSFYQASVNPRVWFEWDYLNLEANSTKAVEPIHGKISYLGTSHSRENTGFATTSNLVKSMKDVYTWLGIAYSGNTVRAEFWSDVTHLQPARLEAFQAFKDLNLTVIADHINSATSAFFNGDGTLSNSGKDLLNSFFTKYGQFFQYYEVDNEPGLFNRKKSINIEIAKFVTGNKPAHIKTTAPGWAYWPTNGDPAGWERKPSARAEVETHCQALGGHSYGSSYADLGGGSFIENMRTLGNITDGWPKEFIVTETGTNDWHAEGNAFGLASTMPNASSYDRILRAHIAVADRTNTHSAIFDDFGIFVPPANYADINLYKPWPGVGGQETRLKTFRRIALAYATHGAPLSYEYINKGDISNKKVYFRAVDTSQLEPLLGSNAKSNKILLNFVNFEGTPQKVNVRVKLPLIGNFETERIDDNSLFSQARTTLQLVGKPDVELNVALEPRGSVQYILTIPSNGTIPPSPTTPPDICNISLVPEITQSIADIRSSDSNTKKDSYLELIKDSLEQIVTKDLLIKKRRILSFRRIRFSSPLVNSCSNSKEILVILKKLIKQENLRRSRIVVKGQLIKL
jgi:hypothetical protein